jgi:hypothetical protein
MVGYPALMRCQGVAPACQPGPAQLVEHPVTRRAACAVLNTPTLNLSKPFSTYSAMAVQRRMLVLPART